MSADFQGPKCGRCECFTSPEMLATQWEWLVTANGRRYKYTTEKSARRRQKLTGGTLMRRPVGWWQEMDAVT